MVLVRPGVHAESVRLTQNCYILGLGPRGKVVVEAPGWESALVSAGLGMGANFGEDAYIENVTFRCRNEMMRGRCVYIVNGHVSLKCCDIQGTVLVSGWRTSPQFVECQISKSRGNGLHFTDYSCPSLVKSTILHHGNHGILIDRRAMPSSIGQHDQRKPGMRNQLVLRW